MTIVRTFSLVLLVACLAVTSTTVSSAQSPPPAEEANTAYDAQDWSKAAPLYEQLTAADPKNGRAWYRLGVSLRGLGQNEKAIQAFDKAIAAGAPNFLAEYQSALVLAALHQDDRAFAFLEKALTNGYAQPEALQAAPELAALRSDSRFSKLLEQANRNQKPCVYAPESRQFDFWAGEWNVVSTQGGISAGSSRIEKILNDCVILENWSSANAPYQGKSYNTYNTSLKRWEQFWVDNSQGMIHFYGELKAGVMDYWTDEMPQPDGKKLKRHLQFIPQGPDKVRQFSQGTYDNGGNWFVEYDLTYLRKK